MNEKPGLVDPKMPVVTWPRGESMLATSDAEMGHRPPLPEQLDLDGNRTVGHLGDEGGVEGAQRLGRIGQFLGHGPQRRRQLTMPPWGSGRRFHDSWMVAWYRPGPAAVTAVTVEK